MGDVGRYCACTGRRDQNPQEMIPKNRYCLPSVQSELTRTGGSVTVGTQLLWAANVVTKTLDLRRRTWVLTTDRFASKGGSRNKRQTEAQDHRQQRFLA